MIRNSTIGIFTVLFAATLIFSACYGFWMSETDDCENPDYSDCDTHEPFFADLEILVSREDNADLDRLQVFYGPADHADSLVTITEFDGEETKVFVTVSTNAEYSAKAYYLNGADTIIAIDGTNFRKRSYTNCDSTCWYLTGDVLDLEVADR